MLNYRRTGKGPVLVIQHGFLGGLDYWAPQVRYFARDFDVITPDLPGFAGSGGMSPPTTVAGFAPILIDFLDRLSIKRFTIMGHSLGGMVVQQMALDFPDRVERLILYGTAAIGGAPGRFESIDDSIKRVLATGISTHADKLVPTWFANGANDPYYAMCRKAGEGLTAESAVKIMKAASTWDITARLGEIKAPTLVICGDRDRACRPDHSIKAWQTIPNASLSIIPGCAHCAHLERPDIFNAIVGDFLKRGV